MKYIIILIALAFHVGSALCQIKKSDLDGRWTMCNENDLYATVDTIVLHQDINYQYYVKECCHFINWNIKSKSIEIEQLFSCLEPGSVTKDNVKRTIKLLKSNHNQVIVIYENGKISRKFKVVKFETFIVNRYPYEIKSLILKKEH